MEIHWRFVQIPTVAGCGAVETTDVSMGKFTMITPFSTVLTFLYEGHTRYGLVLTKEGVIIFEVIDILCTRRLL